MNNVAAAMCCDAKLVDAAHVHTTHQLHHDATCVLTHGGVQFYLFLEYPVEHDDDWEAESPQLRPRSSRASLAHHHSIPTENARQVQQLRRATVDGPRVAIVQCAALVLMFLLMVRCKSEAQLCWQTRESSGTVCILLHVAVALAHMHAFRSSGASSAGSAAGQTFKWSHSAPSVQFGLTQWLQRPHTSNANMRRRAAVVNKLPLQSYHTRKELQQMSVASLRVRSKALCARHAEGVHSSR